jgi:hypothetical protein
MTLPDFHVKGSIGIMYVTGVGGGTLIPGKAGFRLASSATVTLSLMPVGTTEGAWAKGSAYC